MLIRIVRMTFKEEKVTDFLTTFHASKEKIRTFEGCNYLELLQDENQPTIFMTYSYWDNEKCLNNYRNSDLFKEVWAATKVLFSDKPMAFSSQSVVKLDF